MSKTAQIIKKTKKPSLVIWELRLYAKVYPKNLVNQSLPLSLIYFLFSLLSACGEGLTPNAEFTACEGNAQCS